MLLKFLIAAAALLVAACAQAQVTVYTATPNASYFFKTDFTVCNAGPCQNFTLGMSQSGSFTTANPLPPNLAGANVLGLVTAFSFTDGLTTYANTDANVRVRDFTISTDGAGAIVGYSTRFERWETGTAPHATGDRFSLVQLVTNSGNSFRNAPCDAVGVSVAGVADACVLFVTIDTGVSSASAGGATWTSVTAAAPAVATQAIPTLSEWALVLTAALMALAGFAGLRRQSRLRLEAVNETVDLPARIPR